MVASTPRDVRQGHHRGAHRRRAAPEAPVFLLYEMVSSLKAACPELAVKAFTAIEIRHLAERIAKKPIAETLEILRAAGLNSLTGGGAENFDPAVRDTICRGKESADEWLEVHRTWHQMGPAQHPAPCSTATWRRPRSASTTCAACASCRTRRTASTAIVPFAYEPENNKLTHLGLGRASAFEDLRNLAIARLFLDNFDHITAVLDQPRPAHRAGRAELRRRRPARHHPAGENFPHGRQQDAARPDRREAGGRHPRGRAHSDAAQHLLRAHQRPPRRRPAAARRAPPSWR